MMQSISQLCEPNLNALLYGVTDLSNETNRQPFIIIQEYIKELNDSNILHLSYNSLLIFDLMNYYTFKICLIVKI